MRPPRDSDFTTKTRDIRQHQFTLCMQYMNIESEVVTRVSTVGLCMTGRWCSETKQPKNKSRQSHVQHLQLYFTCHLRN